jgi:hypothetical protein
VTSFQALLSGLWVEVVKPAFVARHDVEEEVIAFDSISSKHVGDSHFLAVHDGNVRGAHALIFQFYWRGKMPLMVL